MNGKRKHYDVTAAVEKLTWLAMQGLAVENLQRIAVDYYSKKDHKAILKVKTKKYMLALALATLQCTFCFRWFTHEATLRQHIKFSHEEGLGVKPIYQLLLLSREGLAGSALPLCGLC